MDIPTPRVVVGVDGSSVARLALAWALRAAATRTAELVVLSAFPVEVYWLDPHLVDQRRVEAIRADTEERMRGLVEEVRREQGAGDLPGLADVPVRVLATAGPAAAGLVGQSADADLLVVGSRGRGAVRSTLLGSVALHCTVHARCPVVVVRPPAAEDLPARSEGPRVVVGLDDSAPARAALVAAVAEARLLGARVQAVLAYRLPDLWSELYAGLTPEGEDARAQAQAAAEAVVADTLGAERDGVEVTVVEGPAGEVLTRRAAGAELLVVGSRSRSRLPGMVLGSVALHCVVYGPCPVMVARPVPRPAGSRPSMPAGVGGD